MNRCIDCQTGEAPPPTTVCNDCQAIRFTQMFADFTHKKVKPPLPTKKQPAETAEQTFRRLQAVLL